MAPTRHDSIGAGACFLTDLLRLRAKRQPSRVAYRFLANGADETITTEVLDRRARSIARALCGRAASGTPILAMFPAGLDFIAAFFGCLYARGIAVPVAPPLNPGQWSRFEAIREASGAVLGLTTSALLSTVRRRQCRQPGLDAVSWQPVDAGALEASPDGTDEPSSSSAVAYLQFTSGSTADPKGVMVTHANVLANLCDLERVSGHRPESVGVSWLPHVHDMGLVFGILSPLFGGYEGVLMSPLTFIQRPFAWIEALSRHRATHTAAPNFAYDVCARRCASRSLDGINLNCLAFAANGAEPVRRDTMDRFARTFAPCGFRASAFRPAYGLAEATLLVTVAGKTRRDETPLPDGSRAPVCCGRPPAGTTVAIVDSARRTRMTDGATGEIWVSGPGVAAGYWGRHEDTQHTFNARLCDSDAGPFLRTGDLGFVNDGHLAVTGRLKDLVVVAGRNHYPADLEQTAEDAHPAVRRHGCAVFAIEADGLEQLAIAVEIDPLRPFDDGQSLSVVAAIRQAIASRHDVQPSRIALVAPGSIPRTSSGKIRRTACHALLVSKGPSSWTPPR